MTRNNPARTIDSLKLALMIACLSASPLYALDFSAALERSDERAPLKLEYQAKIEREMGLKRLKQMLNSGSGNAASLRERAESAWRASVPNTRLDQKRVPGQQ